VDLLLVATDRFPTDFNMHWALATMLRDLGRFEEAQEVATNLSEMYPQAEAVQDLLRSLREP
jgi:hypothetical protein